MLHLDLLHHRLTRGQKEASTLAAKRDFQTSGSSKISEDKIVFSTLLSTFCGIWEDFEVPNALRQSKTAHEDAQEKIGSWRSNPVARALHSTARSFWDQVMHSEVTKPCLYMREHGNISNCLASNNAAEIRLNNAQSTLKLNRSALDIILKVVNSYPG